MESFAFFLVEYQIERDGLAREIYFRMPSEIYFIGTYFYTAGISTEPQLSVNIPRTLCTTFHQQNSIDICFVEVTFFENVLRKKKHVILFLEKVQYLIISS